MELDHQSLFWAPCVQLYLLTETPQPTPSLPFGLIYKSAMVSQDRRHLFVTPCKGVAGRVDSGHHQSPYF